MDSLVMRRALVGAGCLGLIGLAALLYAVLAVGVGGAPAAAPVYPIPPLPLALATPVPSPTAAFTPSPTAPPAATPTPTPPTIYVIANTGGLGAALRRELGSGERIRGWQDGTEMVEVAAERLIGQQVWRNVRDPAGNVGWIAADLLAVSPRATPRATVTAVATVVPTPSATPEAVAAPPSPPPYDLDLLAVDSYRQGGLVVVEGKLSNAGERGLSSLWAEAQWFDHEWQLVKSHSAPIRHDPLLPGQACAFKVVATDHPDIAYYTVDFRESRGDFLLIRHAGADLP